MPNLCVLVCVYILLLSVWIYIVDYNKREGEGIICMRDTCTMQVAIQQDLLLLTSSDKGSS